MLTLLAILTTIHIAGPRPIALHPENPRYLLFRGNPAVLITSGEHYGAVLNRAFDYVAYLETLHKDGLNLTRTFSGAYRELPGNFNIQGNTLAPAKGNFLCPWARTSTPGESDGGGKFDLTKWDEAYFRRLKEFVAQAGKRGIMVELVLFCPFYEDSMWNASPMNSANNVNRIGTMPRTEVYTLKHPDMLNVQEAMVRKIVRELNRYDNLYYEICNEPYFGGVTLDWQARIAQVIAETQAGMPNRHLIAQNIANGSARVDKPIPQVSIFNFHYASPPVAVTDNAHLNRPIGFDETGFKGTDDFTYRAQAWEFMLAGGAIFDNLDYSFTTATPDGTSRVSPPTPGGGSPALRKQLAILKRFMEGFDLIHMSPDSRVVRGPVPNGVVVTALSQPGKAYAIYMRGDHRITLNLEIPTGNYQAEWLDTKSGEILKQTMVKNAGGLLTLEGRSEFTQDVALKLVAVR